MIYIWYIHPLWYMLFLYVLLSVFILIFFFWYRKWHSQGFSLELFSWLIASSDTILLFSKELKNYSTLFFLQSHYFSSIHNLTFFFSYNECSLHWTKISKIIFKFLGKPLIITPSVVSSDIFLIYNVKLSVYISNSASFWFN